MKDYTYARAAYKGYCASTGGVSLISGDKLPEFEALKPEIQEAWYAAAMAVSVSVRSERDEVEIESTRANADLMRAQAELCRAQAKAIK